MKIELILDSVESTTREIALLFPEFDINHWYLVEENYFRCHKVILDRKNFVHKIKSK